MADPISPTTNVEKFRESQVAHALHRGNAERTGGSVTHHDHAQNRGAHQSADSFKAHHRDHKTHPGSGTPVHQEAATVVHTETLPEGRTHIKLSDGRSILKAANQVLRENDPDGTFRLSLPNGILVQRDADGHVSGFDPTSGKRLHVQAERHSEHGQYYFHFKDDQGRKYLATSDTLRFEVTNASGTIHQKISANGQIHVETTTIFRKPKAGGVQQETRSVTVHPDGRIVGHGVRHNNVHLDNRGISYTQNTGVRVQADLPYPIPFALKGETAEYTAPTPSPAPSTLVQTDTDTAPAPAVPTREEPPAEPETPVRGPASPVMTTDPAIATQQPPTPVNGVPRQAQSTVIPPNAYGPPLTLTTDQYTPVTTAGGVTRQTRPDGSMFVALPNGVVFSHMPDGTNMVVDARLNQPLPAMVRDVVTPNGGPEKQIAFSDAAGNQYLMYSKSLDFAVSSADGRLRQIVMPQGNILIMAQTPVVGQNGQPMLSQHMVEIFPNGMVNTFGEPGVQLRLDGVQFTQPNGPPVGLSLPYPIPPFQGMLQAVQSVAAFPTAVSGTMHTPGTQGPPTSGPIPVREQVPGQAPQAPPPAPAQAAASLSTPTAPPRYFWNENGPVWRQTPAAPTTVRLDDAAPDAARVQVQATQDQDQRAALIAQMKAQIKQGVSELLGPDADRKQAQLLEDLYFKVACGQANEQEARQLESLLRGAVKDGVARLLGPDADPGHAQRMEDLYFKQITGQASQQESQDFVKLVQDALAAKQAPGKDAAAQTQPPQTPPPPPTVRKDAAPRSQPAQMPQPTKTEPANTVPQTKPTVDPGEPTETPPVASPVPTPDPQQVAIVEHTIQQMANAGASTEVLNELRPLVTKIVMKIATPDEQQRAERMAHEVLGKTVDASTTVRESKKAAAPPPSGAEAPVYAIPHMATARELYLAANGQPEYALASNAPQEYFTWAEPPSNDSPAATTHGAQPAQPPPGEAPPTDTTHVIPEGASPHPAAAAPGAADDTPPPAPPAPSVPLVLAAPPASYPRAAQPPIATTNVPVLTPPIPGSRPVHTVNPGQPVPMRGEFPAPTGAPSAPYGPHTPGIWQRIKNFFNAGSPGPPRYMDCDPYSSWRGYPSQMYGSNPYRAMETMMATQMLMTTLSTMLFMPSMYFWNPVAFMGGCGAFSPMMCI